jgi:chitinase
MKPVSAVHFSQSMLGTLLVGILTFIVCIHAAAQDRSRSDDHTKVVGGYFEEWGIYYAGFNVANLQQNGVADKLTHLTYAFGGVTASGCTIADSWADFQSPYLPSVSGVPYPGPLYGNFAALQQLKQFHPKLKVLISLGGASAAATAGFVTAASTAQGRTAFAASCIDLFINGNVAPGISAAGIFDGIDIDWEFPTAADKQNATALVQEFRAQLSALGKANHKHYLLTMFAPAGADNYSNLELRKVARELDYYNLQGYDLHGTWETSTNHQAALFESRQDPAFGQGLSIEPIVKGYLAANVPPRKIVLGIPLYGYGWTGVPNVNHGLYQSSTAVAPVLLASGAATCPDLSGITAGCDPLLTPGVMTYSTLSTLASNGYQSYFDRKRVAKWLYDSSSQTFWNLEDPLIVRIKMLYVRSRVKDGLGGAYVWALKDDDASGSIVKSIAAGLSSK